MRLLALAISSVLLISGVATAAENPLPSRSSLSAAAFASSSQPAKAAVPKADKATGELIGTVAEVRELGSICGIQSVIVWVVTTKPYNFPVSAAAVCAGNTLSSCRSLVPGRRVRLQGVISPAPDSTTPGFSPCDPGTWEFITPSYGFGVTKVFK